MPQTGRPGRETHGVFESAAKRLREQERNAALRAQAGEKIATALPPLYRQHKAAAAQAHMRETGINWESLYLPKVDHVRPEATDRLSVLSTENIRNLTRRLAPLAADEKGFLDAFLKTPLYATHASDGPVVNSETGTFRLFSRETLTDRDIDFDHSNTSDADIQELGGIVALTTSF